MRATAFAIFTLAAALFPSGCSRPAAKPVALRPIEEARPSSQPGQRAEIHSRAPDFSLKTFDGKTIRLSALKGKPVVLNFWASWCHFCAQEAPDLEAAYKECKSSGLQVLGVGLDDADALAEKTKKLKLTYPVGFSPEAGREYGVMPIPQTFFIDRQGVIVSQFVGARPRADLEAEVKKIL